jgi:6-phosphogluconate dehydrogenase
MKEGLGLTPARIGDTFDRWNHGTLESSLIEITRDILGYLDEDGSPIVEKILDMVEQKGIGKWAGISTLDLGIPLTMLVEAVFGRALSSLKDERSIASRGLTGPQPLIRMNLEKFIVDL